MAPADDEEDAGPVEQQLYEPLTEEECYLAAILMDRSGADMAEFLWPDHSTPDGCFRLYPYQFAWWRAEHELSIDQGARDTGKSERVCARANAFPFSFPGEEHALIAPEGSHIDRLTSRIESRISSVWLLREMIRGGLRGINHNPFEIKWKNGAQTYSRLPQRSGIGIKGVHAVWLDVDEAQDISEQTWKEMPLVVRRDVPGARWACHGVSKGVHDEFWRKTQANSGWVVHRVTQLHKPTYDKANRPQLIKEHGGSEESGDFKRNVYGEHGDTQNRIFVLTHFMAGVDVRREGSSVNNEYYQPTIVGDEIAARLGSKVAVETSSEEATAVIIDMAEFLPVHRSKYKTFWAGMDVGLVGDPTEIVVLAEYVPDKRERAEHQRPDVSVAVPEEGVSRFRLVTRIRLLRVPEPLQADLIMHLIDFYKPVSFSLDAGGNGLPVFQELQKRAGRSRIIAIEPPTLAEDATAEQRSAYDIELATFAERKSKAQQALTVIKAYKFGSKIPVEFIEAEVEKLGPNPDLKEMLDKATLHQEAKTRATDVLRTLVDNRRLLMPNDEEFIDQMNGQTMSYSTEPIDAYGKRRAVFSTGTFHILDAMRFFALGWSQTEMERIVSAAEKPATPVLDRFVPSY